MIESRHFRFAQPTTGDHRSLRGDIQFGSGRLQIGQQTSDFWLCRRRGPRISSHSGGPPGAKPG
jgi:hypothetical protein